MMQKLSLQGRTHGLWDAEQNAGRTWPGCRQIKMAQFPNKMSQTQPKPNSEEQEFDPFEGFDKEVQSAPEPFTHLDCIQAADLFRENIFDALQDMEAMGIKAFLYYLKSLEIYIKEAMGNLLEHPIKMNFVIFKIHLLFEHMFEQGHKQAIVENKAANSIRTIILTNMNLLFDKIDMLIATNPSLNLKPEEMTRSRELLQEHYKW